MNLNSDNSQTNGWNQWSRYVLKELERLNETIIRLEDFTEKNTEKINMNIDNKINYINKKIDDITQDIISLKIKAAGWGFLAGALPQIITIFFWIFENILKK